MNAEMISKNTLSWLPYALGEMGGVVRKAGLSTSSGLVAIDLEEMAKVMVPEFSPYLQSVPRVSTADRAGIQPVWRQITSFNNQGQLLYVPEGKRGSVISYTTATKSAPYVTLGLENLVTFEEQAAIMGFDDANRLATLGLLQEAKAQEERQLIFGNAGLALAASQPAAPTCTVESSGGSLQTSQEYWVGVIALTGMAYYLWKATGRISQAVSQSQAGPYGGTTAFNGGSAWPSALATPSTVGASNSIVGTVPAVLGAVAYAWYWSFSASHQYLGAVTTINSVNITADSSSAAQDLQTMTLTADFSKNTLSYDGVLSTIAQSGYTYTMPTGTVGVGGAGTGLTVGSSNFNIVEIDAVLRYMWDNFNTGIDEIYINSQEQANITAKVAYGSSSAIIRMNVDINSAGQANLRAGTMVGSYLNQFAFGGATNIPFILHPYVPAGTMIFRAKKLPYNYTNVGMIERMVCREDYKQFKWPQVQRQYEFGIYWQPVYQNYAPFAFAQIVNIANK